MRFHFPRDSIKIVAYSQCYNAERKAVNPLKSAEIYLRAIVIYIFLDFVFVLDERVGECLADTSADKCMKAFVLSFQNE
jgi:hypothetical protein